MRFVMFYHSLVSDWNHGNAHFLRGIVSELLSRGHEVRVYEPEDGWSLKNLITEHGEAPIKRFYSVYPGLKSIKYDPNSLDLGEALDGADVVIVHEWNDHDLVRRIGKHRDGGGKYKLLFHDTHHRSATDPENMAAYDLSNYDGVLVFGEVIRDIYLSKGWAERVWTWHEAADTRVFHHIEKVSRQGDLVWIGNWGDGERTAELQEFLIEPVKSLCLKAQAHGVRYPDYGKRILATAGINYGGWLPNYDVPTVFAGYRVTVHVPRRPYAAALPGIPTIRVFEALACGIPLVSAFWDDIEGLFTPGEDFLVASNGSEMKRHLRTLLHDKEAAAEIKAHGLKTILEKHTCAHRVDELFGVLENR
ncbi:MAG: glycosyltransferase [Armatimonadota bacterium]